MNTSPALSVHAAPVKGLQRRARGFAAGQRLPDLRARVGTLHGNHREVARAA